MKINFRLLQLADREDYRQVVLECLKNHPDNFGTTYDEALQATSLKLDKALTTTASNDFLFGAFFNETLVGICGFIQDGRYKTRHRGEIVQMYVNPAFSGQGIGTKLLRSAIDKVFEHKAIDQVLLSVVYSNEKAVMTYKKLGFVQYGLLENFFKDGENSWTQLFMVLTREQYNSVAKE